MKRRREERPRQEPKNGRVPPSDGEQIARAHGILILNLQKMKNPVYPLSTWNPSSVESFNLEDSDDLIGVMKNLIDGNHPGLLTTVDERNRPHARWMATFAFEKFPHIYTLTSPQSRKLAHIARNPYVDWTFSNQDLSLILNLSGTAQALTKIAAIKRAWRMVEDKSHAYFLNNFNEKPGFAVLETVVTGMECCIPQSGFRWSADVDSLKPATKLHSLKAQS